MTPKYLLCLETSTSVCSVALAQLNGTVVGYRNSQPGTNHAQVIGVYVDELLTQCSAVPSEVAAVVVAEGPGSYTGLRIAASFAKGFCFSLQIPLIAVPTLLSMVHVFRQQELGTLPSAVTCMPMIDARRMEVYTALYHCDLAAGLIRQEHEVTPLVLTETEAVRAFLAKCKQNTLVCFGDGAAKGHEILCGIHEGDLHLLPLLPNAKGLVAPGLEAYEKKEFRDIAYWAPLYLKEYNAKQSLNKVLGEVRTK